MSDPTKQFDYQAQPFWDEEGNYFPPGFDPQTGEWTDQAFADAYAQGFVWDAASQQWVQAPGQQAFSGEDAGLQAADLFGESVQEPSEREHAAALDARCAEEAKQLEEAIGRVLKEENGDEDEDRLSERTAQAASDIRALLDSVARGGDETTVLTAAVPDALAAEVTSLVRTAMPAAPEQLRTVLTAETDEAIRHAEQAESLDASEEAPPPLYFIRKSDLAPRPDQLLNDPEFWALAAQLDQLQDDRPRLKQDGEDATDDAAAPYSLPAANENEEDLQGALSLKNGLPLPLDFDGESPAPGTARILDTDEFSLPTSLQSFIRADNVLRAVAPQCLDLDIYLPLDDPRPETLLVDGCRVGPDGKPDASNRPSAPADVEHASALPAIQVRRLTPNPFHTNRPGSEPPVVRRPNSAPPREENSNEASPLPSEFQMPSVRVRLKKPATDGTAASSSQQRRLGTGGAFIDVVTPADIPSDDIELALTSACRRQSKPPHAAETESHPQNPLGKTSSSLPPIVRPAPTSRLANISPLPGPHFFSKNSPGLVKPIPGNGRQQLSQKPSAAVPVSSKPIKLNGTYTVLCRLMTGNRTISGRLHNPTLTAPSLTIEVSPTAQKVELKTKEIQTIFFQRPNSDTFRPSGRKARLIFHGGTQRTGFLPIYDPHAIGFIFFPLESEQTRYGYWFVYRQAVASIDFVDG